MSLLTSAATRVHGKARALTLAIVLVKMGVGIWPNSNREARSIKPSHHRADLEVGAPSLTMEYS
jgi:hypothetical protein